MENKRDNSRKNIFEERQHSLSLSPLRARFVGNRTKFRNEIASSPSGRERFSLEKHDGDRDRERRTRRRKGGRMDKRKGEEGRGGGLFHTHVKLGEFRYNGYLYARLESVALCKHGDRGRGMNSRGVSTLEMDVTSAARLWFLNGQLGLPQLMIYPHCCEESLINF